MFNAWVLDLAAQPPVVVAHVDVSERIPFYSLLESLSNVFSLDLRFTIVTEYLMIPPHHDEKF